MTKGSVLKAAVNALVEVLAGEAGDEKALGDAVVRALNDMSPLALNVKRLRIALGDEAEEQLEALLGWLENDGIDTVEHKQTWMNLMKPSAPAVEDAKHNAPQPAASAAPSLRSLGVKIELDKYSGERGECGNWWQQFQRTATTLHVPEGDMFALVAHALEGDAKTEFWHVHKARAGRHGDQDVAAIVQVLIALFDAGQHVHLLKKWRGMEQRKGETVLKFRTRYMKVLDSLQLYKWTLSDEQMVADFGSRLLDWSRIATHKPASVEAILRAVAELGESVGNDSKAAPLMAMNSPQVKCWNCNGAHFRRDCKAPPKKRKCHRCKSESHLVAECTEPDPKAQASN